MHELGSILLPDSTSLLNTHADMRHKLARKGGSFPSRLLHMHECSRGLHYRIALNTSKSVILSQSRTLKQGGASAPLFSIGQILNLTGGS